MRCAKCEREVAGDAVFCSRCGTRTGLPRPDAEGLFAPRYPAPWQPAGAASVAAAFLIPKEEMQRRRVPAHLQTLGIAWCLWGLYRLLAGAVAGLTLHALARHGLWPGDTGVTLPGLFPFLLPALALGTATTAALSLLAGWALLRAKPWGRTLAIVLGIVSLPKFPLGTVLGVYTLWVLAPRAAGQAYTRHCTAQAGRAGR